VFVWRAKDFEGWDTVEYPTDGGNYVHPTQKPVQLMAWLMKVTQSGKTVCDPFMGSGTTGLACLRTGRNFIGIERDAAHYKTACDRIAHELDGALL
jgi:DNA modification methylase